MKARFAAAVTAALLISASGQPPATSNKPVVGDSVYNVLPLTINTHPPNLPVGSMIGLAPPTLMKGTIDCSSNPDYPAANKGWFYRSTVAGKIGGVSGTEVETGAIMLCLDDGTAAGDEATVGFHWLVFNTYLDDDITLTADSNARVPTQHAVKEYADAVQAASQPYSSELTAIAVLTGTGYGRGFLTLTDEAAAVTKAGLTDLNGGTTDQVLAKNSNSDLDFKWVTGGGGGGAVDSVFGRTGAVVAASNDYTFAQLASKPTTIAGFGITDFNSLGDARWSLLAHTHTFASLTSKPTTIGGYGITDFNSLGDARWDAIGAAASAQAASQPLDSDLTAIAALTTTSFGRGGLTQTDAAGFRSYIGAGSGGGDFSSNTATSVDSEVVLFSSTTGKLGKRATGSGLATLTSGVLGTTTNNSTNWDTAFSQTRQWDGGATGLVAATGRTSLGLGTLATQSGTFSGTSSGTNTGDQSLSGLQPLDADLTTLAGLTATTDNFIVSVASAWASRTPTQVKTTLGLTIGTNVEAWDADLDSVAALTTDSFGLALLTKTSAANIRTYIGAGTGSGDALVANPLSQFAATTSAQLRGVLTDESGTGVFLTDTGSAASLTSFPTLNQNTSGSAASLSISGQTGLLTFTGLASTNRQKTVRDAADTILELGGSYTPTGTWTNMAFVTPTGIVKGDVGLGSVTNDAQTKAAVVPNTAPSAGQILAGNAGGTAYAPVTLSGSGATATLSSAGVLTLSAIPNATLSNSSITIGGTSTALGGSVLGNVENTALSTWAGSANITTLGTITTGTVPFARLTGTAASGAIGSSGLTMATARLLGRTTASTGPVEEITVGSGLSLSSGTLTSTGSGGTVTDFSAGDLSPLFTTSEATTTTTPALTFALSNAAAWTIFGNGTSGSAGPTFETATGTGSPVRATSPALTTPTGIVKGDVGLGSVTNDAQTKAAIVPNTAPSAGQILAGNAGGTAYAPVTLSGSGATATLSSAGVLTLSGIANASLSNSSITIGGTSTALGGSVLGNVENTALSTWAGSTNITTLGTIATGTVPFARLTGAAASGANTDITSVLLNQTGLVVKGGDSNALTIKPNETLTAGRILNLKVNDAARTIDLSGNLTVPSAATVSGTNTGDQTTISGNAATATALATGRTISITGDLTYTSPSFDGTINITAAGTLANIPTAVPMAGSLLATAITAPGTPASGKGSIYVDSTSKNLAVKDDAGVVKHGVQTDTGASNNFLTAISDAGVITKAQPAFSNLSGSVAASQMPALTGDVTTSAGAVATTLASVASAGTTGSSTAIPVVTINAKGLTTGITTAAVVAPAGTLSGATLASGVTASSLTSFGSSIVLGTPASGVMTNVTGTASGLTAGNVITNADLTGEVTSVGNETTLDKTLNYSWTGQHSFQQAATVASTANALLDNVYVGGQTHTVTGGTQITNSNGFNNVNIYRPTITDSSAVTIDQSATLRIANSPLAAGSVTITNPYALWVDAGVTRLDGGLTVGGTATVSNGVINASTGFTIGGAAGSGKILKGNGTNFVASTETYAAPGTSGNVATSDGTNWTSAAPAAAAAGSLTGATLASGVTASSLTSFGSTPTLVTPAIGAATGTSLVLSSFLNEAKGADIASASTTAIGAATGNYLDVTGTTTITGLGTISSGTRRIVRFTGALTLTHNGTSLKLPGAANITTVPGDVAEFVSLGSSNWQCTKYTPITVTGTGSTVLSISPTLTTPNLGTPSTLVGTSISGTGASFTAGNVTTNANLTGDETSSGNTVTWPTYAADGVAPTCGKYIVWVARKSGIDFKTAATTDIFTVPTGKTAVVSQAIAVVDSVTSAGAGTQTFQIIESGAAAGMTGATASSSGTPAIGTYYVENSLPNTGKFTSCAAAAKIQYKASTSHAGSTAVSGTVFVTGMYY